jgi:hypothetical protein
MKNSDELPVKNSDGTIAYTLLLSDKDGFYLISSNGFHVRIDEHIFNILKEKGLISEK